MAGQSGPDTGDSDDIPASTAEADEIRRSYWRDNIRLLSLLMGIWALVSFGAGILFRPFLDQFMLGGYPLGFWFAQQGSIYIFIILVIVYSLRMRALERRYDLDD